MVKLLIGGSPCTHWSIAQTKNRETKPEGLGWKLFKIALTGMELEREKEIKQRNVLLYRWKWTEDISKHGKA